MATPSEKTLREVLRLDAEKAIELKSALNKADRSGKPADVDAALDLADGLMGTYGVEAIRGEGWEDPYYGDIIALYVNTGETYEGTLLYDVEAERFYATSWGDWVEAQERKGRHIPNEEAAEEPATENPGGRVLGQIGDLSPLDHSGGVVYVADDGTPWLEWTWGLEEHEGVDPYDKGVKKVMLTIYHVDLGETGDQFLRQLDWVEWGQVAKSIGMSKSELLEHGHSDNPMARASVAEAVAGHYGWHELDTYPIEMSYGELDRRWFPKGKLAKRIGAERRRNTNGRARENPLKHGWSRQVISGNVRKMVRDGYPQKQAVAASLDTARSSYRARHPKGRFPRHLQYQKNARVMTFGVMPTFDEFEEAFDREVPEGEFGIKLGRSDAEAAEGTSIGSGEYTAPELYQGVVELLEKWEDGNEEAGSIASSIMSSLDYEWV